MTGTSLKGYTPRLAAILGSTPAALYERQRELTRGGLLDQNDGRGPGSGVRTTRGSVALLVTSMLSTESLSGSSLRTNSIADSEIRGGKCGLTSATHFQSAFSIILASSGLAARIIEISVSRTTDHAWIRYRNNDGEPAVSEFVGKHAAEPAISVHATLGANTVKAIARDVQAINVSEFEDSLTSTPITPAVNKKRQTNSRGRER